DGGRGLRPEQAPARERERIADARARLENEIVILRRQAHPADYAEAELRAGDGEAAGRDIPPLDRENSLHGVEGITLAECGAEVEREVAADRPQIEQPEQACRTGIELQEPALLARNLDS